MSRENKSRSELRPPDAKRSRGDTRPLSPASRNTNIPVFQRRKMFEQADSGMRERSQTVSGFASQPNHGSEIPRKTSQPSEQPDFGHSEKLTVTGKRTGRFASRKGDVGRSSSFRASKKIKTDAEGSPMLRHKPMGTSALWLRLRYFGHYDTQSMTIERLATEKGTGEHSVKKATGASAAHYVDIEALRNPVANDLVASCPTFTNEVGGDSDWVLEGEDSPILLLRDSLNHEKQRRVASREKMVLDGDIPLKDVVLIRGPMSRQASEVFQPQSGFRHALEYIDYGALFYRNYFLGQEHQNFFGIDENLGPIAISLKREKFPEELAEFYGTTAPPGPNGMPKHLYRVILRTSELTTLRGTVLEDVIPSGTKAGTSRGLPPRDVVDYISQGEVQLSCLRLGKQEKKVHQELARLDEQELNNKYKIGVLYCKPGQTTEEEIYNNEEGSPAFDEFLKLLGKKVKMKGFTKYRAQLDNKTDTTGKYSVYREFRDTEIMFHVSTLLPHTDSNKQQLLRKRHIGNDIVTVIFQEPGCKPFSPKCIRSQFQHIFVVVRVENPNTAFAKYRVAVARSHDIPYFGPSIPEGGTFDKNEQFQEFFVTKLINACNASLRSEKFSGMAIRTRRQYLTDLSENSTSGLNIDQAASSSIVAGFLSKNWGSRKRERTQQNGPLIFTPGALTWNVSVILRKGKPLPFSEEHDLHMDCILGLGADMMVFLDSNAKGSMVLHIPTKDISGWIQDKTRLNIYYDDCYCLSIEGYDSDEDVKEIALRMHTLAPMINGSHEAVLMEFRRGPNGLLGFGINEAGVVQKVDGLAKSTGLHTNSRLLQVEDRLLSYHTHAQITELLTDKHRKVIKAYVIPPPPTQCRPLLHYLPINWPAVWSARPQNGDSEETSSKLTNGEPMDTGKPPVAFRQKRLSQVSNTSRHSYIEAVTGDTELPSEFLQLPYDDSEPLYDRLMNFDSKVTLRPPKSPRSQRAARGDNVGYNRVRRTNRPTRESVVQFADNLMEMNMGRSRSLEPEPTEHKIDVYSPRIHTQVATSTSVENRPHTAASLSLLKSQGNRRTSTRPPNIEITAGSPKGDMPMTPGQVQELAKKFSFSPRNSTSTGTKTTPSKIPTPSSHSTPMKATTSSAKMTKSGIPTKSQSSHTITSPTGKENDKWDNEVQMRSSKKVKMRPASWDASLIFNSDKDATERSKDDSMVFDDSLESQSFQRNSNIRTAFRRKSSSRELSPEPTNETTATREAKLPDSSSKDEDLSLEQQFSQGLRGSSQDERENPKLSVRQRTQKWEQRGGGVPSYYTLPRSFRARRNASKGTSSNVSSPMTESSEFEFVDGDKTHSRYSVSGIPRPLSRIPSPRSMSVSQPPAATKSKHPERGSSSGTRLLTAASIPKRASSVSPTADKSASHREEADGSSNPDEALLQRSIEREMIEHGGTTPSPGKAAAVTVEARESPSSHQPIIKSSKNVSTAVAKQRGRSLLPTKTQIPASSNVPVSTQRSTQPVASGGEREARENSPAARVASPTQDAGTVTKVVVIRKSSFPGKSSTGSNIPRPPPPEKTTTDSNVQTKSTPPGHSIVIRRSSAPVSGKQTQITSIPRTVPVSIKDRGADARSAYSSPAKSLSLSPTSMGSTQLHNRQKSGDSGAMGSGSFENGSNLLGGMQGLSLTDSYEAKTNSSGNRGKVSSNHLRSGGRGQYSHNIEEWIRQTEESAVEPDAILNEPRDISSPTFTDTSFGQVSDYSQEMVDSLKHKVDHLESKLEKESENNTKLQTELRKMEKQLQEIQSKPRTKHYRSIKTAMI